MRPATDFHALLTQLLPSLQATMADVTISLELALVGAAVNIDVEPLSDAVVALVSNAHKASPASGSITLRTEHVEAAGNEIGPMPVLKPGHYLRLTVADTGAGMDDASRTHAMATAANSANISPRGMSRAYAVVSAAGGALWLDSARGFGTRVFAYLPVEYHKYGRIARTILLVDDEDTVRSVLRRMLVGHGFEVREARDGSEGLRLWLRESDSINAVITDVVMPVMGGRDLAREIRLRSPSVPLLFISAYLGDEPDVLEGLDPPRDLLAKPFTLNALTTALRSVLAYPA